MIHILQQKEIAELMDQALHDFYDTWRIFVTSEVEPKLLKPSVDMYFANANRKQKTLTA